MFNRPQMISQGQFWAVTTLMGSQQQADKLKKAVPRVLLHNKSVYLTKSVAQFS